MDDHVKEFSIASPHFTDMITGFRGVKELASYIHTGLGRLEKSPWFLLGYWRVKSKPGTCNEAMSRSPRAL